MTRAKSEAKGKPYLHVPSWKSYPTVAGISPTGSYYVSSCQHTYVVSTETRC